MSYKSFVDVVQFGFLQLRKKIFRVNFCLTKNSSNSSNLQFSV